MEKILVGDVRDLWAAERLGVGVHRFTAPVAGWRAPELRCKARVPGVRFEPLQSLRAGERVINLKVFAASGKALELEPASDFALELWSYPGPDESTTGRGE